MKIIEVIILGIIQGITEFLPISSSGHLVLAKEILGFDAVPGITFEIVVHFGTFCSIVVYFWDDIIELLNGLLRIVKKPILFFKSSDDDSVDTIKLILISMVPVFVVGIFFKDYIESLFANPLLVAVNLLVTGLILFLSRYGSEKTDKINPIQSLIIGFAQAFAVMPGISRAGSTIATGLYLGITRKRMAKFSFIMVLPVFAGAMLLQILDLIEMGLDSVDYTTLIIGFVASAVSGYLALAFLISILRSKGIYPFAIYCLVVGLIGVWQFA